MSSVTPATRASIHANILDILSMHEELLGELLKAIPNSEYTRDSSDLKSGPKAGRVKWTNIDVVLEGGAVIARPCRSARSSSATQYRSSPKVGLTATPKVAGDVADIFEKMVSIRKGITSSSANRSFFR